MAKFVQPREGAAFEQVPTAAEQQKPQAPDDRQGPGYDNDVSLSSWLRNGDATTKPGFDSTASRLAGGKHRDTP